MAAPSGRLPSGDTGKAAFLDENQAGSCCSVSSRSDHAVTGMEPEAGAARISMHEFGRYTRFEHRANGSAQ
jgi:hypothetical protein